MYFIFIHNVAALVVIVDGHVSKNEFKNVRSLLLIIANFSKFRPARLFRDIVQRNDQVCLFSMWSHVHTQARTEAAPAIRVWQGATVSVLTLSVQG